MLCWFSSWHQLSKNPKLDHCEILGFSQMQINCEKNANYHFFFFLSNIAENNYSGAKRGNKKIQGYACATSADHTACNLHPSPSPDLAANPQLLTLLITLTQTLHPSACAAKMLICSISKTFLNGYSCGCLKGTSVWQCLVF